MKVLIVLVVLCSCAPAKRPDMPVLVKSDCVTCKKPYDRLTKVDRLALDQLIDKIK